MEDTPETQGNASQCPRGPRMLILRFLHHGGVERWGRSQGTGALQGWGKEGEIGARAAGGWEGVTGIFMMQPRGPEVEC